MLETVSLPPQPDAATYNTDEFKKQPEGVINIKRVHRERVQQRRNTIGELLTFSHFLKELKIASNNPDCSTDIQAGKLTDLLAPWLPSSKILSIPAPDIKDISPKTTEDSEKTAEAKNKEIATAIKKYLDAVIILRQSMATPGSIQNKVVVLNMELLQRIIAIGGERFGLGLDGILNTKPTIEISDHQLSPLQLTAAFMDDYTQRVASSEKALLSVELSDPQVAIYDAYRWVRKQSRDPGYIMPTPYTEQILNQMESAGAIRNGLLKFILFGPAGVGKTRLIQEFFARHDKNTLVISFNYFTNFEDLIAQTAITLDSGNQEDAQVKNLEAVLNQLAKENEPDFWLRMERVFMALPPKTKEKYTSVEDLVARYGEELSFKSLPASLGAQEDRAILYSNFKERLETIKDIYLLGFNEEVDLKTRYALAAILQANSIPGMNVIFDEIDKAGPQTMESILTFLSLSPGDTLKFQGGEVKIREDFQIAATSNSAFVGNPTIGNSTISGGANEASLNQYVADRCEQIHLDNQPPKDALMIAAVHLSDEWGRLLISEEEQFQVISAITFVLIKLRQAGLSMPISNRSLKTFCSRLVGYEVKGERRVYFRVKGKDGKPQSVAEAFQLSILDMKEMSMTTDERNKVRKILDDFLPLLAHGSVPDQGSDFNLKLLNAFLPNLNVQNLISQNRLEVVEAIWRQPLFKAIGELESETTPLGHTLVSKVDQFFTHLYDSENLLDLLRESESLDSKAKGLRNGVVISLDYQGLTLAFREDSVPETMQLQRLAVAEDLSGYVVESADQYGIFIIIKKKNDHKLFLINTLDGKKEAIVASNAQRDDQSELNILVDPQGRYIFQKGAEGWGVRSTSSSDKFVVISTQFKVTDISPNGNFIICSQDDKTIVLIDLSQVRLGIQNIAVQYLDSFGSVFKFIGNTILVNVKAPAALGAGQPQLAIYNLVA